MRGVCGCKVPVGFGMLGVAVVFPGGDFVNQRPFVGNAAAEALRGQDAEFGFAEVNCRAWGCSAIRSAPPGGALRRPERLRKAKPGSGY
jgi:hypothetical protein